MKFIIYRDKQNQWRWRLKAANQRTVADSGEGYKSRRNAERAVRCLALGLKDAFYPVIARRAAQTIVAVCKLPESA